MLSALVVSALIGVAPTCSGLEDGLRLFSQQKPAQAMQQLSSLSCESPWMDRWRLHYLGRAKVESGDSELALLDLQSAAQSSLDQVAWESRKVRAEIFAGTDRSYSAAEEMLKFVNHETYGPEAFYSAGRYLRDGGDTANALRIWSDLITTWYESPFAHKAILEILEMPKPYFDNFSRASDYRVLMMARSAYEAGDYSTTQYVLEPTLYRRVDRRLRDEILLIYGNSLYRTSNYDSAITAYRQTMTYGASPRIELEARKGLLMCHLQKGDTSAAALHLKRLDPELFSDGELDRITTIGEIKAHQGMKDAAKMIEAWSGGISLSRSLVDFDKLTSANGAGREIRELHKQAYASALQLHDPSDREIALSLLAQASDGSAADYWREVIESTSNLWLLEYARAEILTNAKRRAEDEAEFVLQTAKVADNSTKMLRLLRLVVYGYPGTKSAEEAEQLLSDEVYRIVSSRANVSAAAPDTLISIAQVLLAAGLSSDAGALIEQYDDYPALLIRAQALKGAVSVGIVDLVRTVQKRLPVAVPHTALPAEFREIAYLLPWRDKFIAAGAKHGLEPALLAAIAREETRFDPTYFSNFRIGILALPTESIEFAKLIPGAPMVRVEELLTPESGLEIGAWYLSHLKETTGLTRPYEIAAAKHAGPFFLPPRQTDRTPLRWIAQVPFPQTRSFLFRVMNAYQIYSEQK